MFTARLADNIGFIFTLSLILLTLVYKFSPLQNRASYLKMLLIYAVGIFVPVYAMILSPQFPNRAWFGLIVFAIIFFGLIFSQLNTEYRFIRLIRYTIVFLFLAAFVFNFYGSYKEIKMVRNIWVEREKTIEDAIKRGNDSIAVRGIDNPSKYVLRDGIWTFPVMSKYYGIEIQEAE